MLTIRGWEGAFVRIRCHPLSSARAGAVVQTSTRIHSLLIEPNELGITKDVFALVANHAAFLGTTSRHVAMAYASKEPDHPLVILDDRSDFWDSWRELAVTLLHELSHLVCAMVGNTPHDADRSPMAKSEAVHDILCYAALGFGIPSQHWAFKKYPELLRKRTHESPMRRPDS